MASAPSSHEQASRVRGQRAELAAKHHSLGNLPFLTQGVHLHPVITTSVTAVPKEIQTASSDSCTRRTPGHGRSPSGSGRAHIHICRPQKNNGCWYSPQQA
jgi:hypothetical protein